jgi:hypothetical protein
MAFPVKQVQALEELLCIIEEVEKNPSEKRTDVAEQLGLPPSTLNMITVKKIREHAYICGLGARNMWCTLWKKCVVSCEVEVAWRKCKVVMVVMVMTTMKPSFTEALCAYKSTSVHVCS